MTKGPHLRQGHALLGLALLVSLVGATPIWVANSSDYYTGNCGSEEWPCNGLASGVAMAAWTNASEVILLPGSYDGDYNCEVTLMNVNVLASSSGNVTFNCPVEMSTNSTLGGVHFESACFSLQYGNVYTRVFNSSCSCAGSGLIVGTGHLELSHFRFHNCGSLQVTSLSATGLSFTNCTAPLNYGPLIKVWNATISDLVMQDCASFSSYPILLAEGTVVLERFSFLNSTAGSWVAGLNVSCARGYASGCSVSKGAFYGWGVSQTSVHVTDVIVEDLLCVVYPSSYNKCSLVSANHIVLANVSLTTTATLLTVVYASGTGSREVVLDRVNITALTSIQNLFYGDSSLRVSNSWVEGCSGRGLASGTSTSGPQLLDGVTVSNFTYVQLESAAPTETTRTVEGLDALGAFGSDSFKADFVNCTLMDSTMYVSGGNFVNCQFRNVASADYTSVPYICTATGTVTGTTFTGCNGTLVRAGAIRSCEFSHCVADSAVVAPIIEDCAFTNISVHDVLVTAKNVINSSFADCVGLSSNSSGSFDYPLLVYGRDSFSVTGTNVTDCVDFVGMFFSWSGVSIDASQFRGVYSTRNDTQCLLFISQYHENTVTGSHFSESAFRVLGYPASMSDCQFVNSVLHLSGIGTMESPMIIDSQLQFTAMESQLLNWTLVAATVSDPHCEVLSLPCYFQCGDEESAVATACESGAVFDYSCTCCPGSSNLHCEQCSDAGPAQCGDSSCLVRASPLPLPSPTATVLRSIEDSTSVSSTQSQTTGTDTSSHATNVPFFALIVILYAISSSATLGYSLYALVMWWCNRGRVRTISSLTARNPKYGNLMRNLTTLVITFVLFSIILTALFDYTRYQEYLGWVTVIVLLACLFGTIGYMGIPLCPTSLEHRNHTVTDPEPSSTTCCGVAACRTCCTAPLRLPLFTYSGGRGGRPSTEERACWKRIFCPFDCSEDREEHVNINRDEEHGQLLEDAGVPADRLDPFFTDLNFRMFCCRIHQSSSGLWHDLFAGCILVFWGICMCGAALDISYYGTAWARATVISAFFGLLIVCLVTLCFAVAFWRSKAWQYDLEMALLLLLYAGSYFFWLVRVVIVFVNIGTGSS